MAVAVSGVYINSAELDALSSGIPHLAVVIYMLALRHRVDFRTGLLGVNPAISWQAITEWVYEEPTGGTVRGAVSRWQCMRAVDWLVKAGLVKIVTSERRLIFKLPLMTLSSHAQIKPATNPQDQPARPSTRENRAKPARPAQGKPAQHPRTESSSVVTTSSNNLARGVSSAGPAGTAASPDGLDWTNRHSAAIRRALAAELQRAPAEGLSADGVYSMHQALLDELEGACRAREVRSPIGYLRALVGKANAGVIRFEYGYRVAEERQRKALSEGRRFEAVAPDEPDLSTDEDKARRARMLPKIYNDRKG